MARWAAAAIWLAAAACDGSEPPPPAAPEVVIPQAEIERGMEACGSYVTKICACTADGAAQDCALAKAMPDAIDVARRIATNPKADRTDARQAARSIRQTVKHCVEQIARLPERGCS